MLLGGPFDVGEGGPGGWWLVDAPELHLGRDVLVPDLAGWRRARMPSPPAPETPYVTLAPDWVCEVLSPSTAQHDRVDKLAVYAREGVAHVWLLDPLARTLEVLRRTPEGWLLALAARGGQTVRAEPFEALALGLAALWPAAASTSP